LDIRLKVGRRVLAERPEMKNLARSRFLAGGAAALALGPQAARAQTPMTFRLAGVPTDDITPVIYALNTGMYEKAGLNLQFIPVSSGATATTAVIAGAYEIAKASPIAPMLAHIKGLPIQIIANGIVSSPRTPYSGMLVATDSTIRSGADCNGKIGVSPGLSDINSLAMMTWIDRNGGDARTVKWVEVPGSAAAEAVGDHRVDFALIQEPQLSAALANGKVRVLSDAYAAVSSRWITSSFVAQTDFAAQHAEALRTFVRVTYQAAGYVNGHKAETIPFMSELTKISPAAYAKMTRGNWATSGDPGLLQPIIDMAVRYKALPAAFPAKEMYWTG
jgi:NitT/TauT family transport system substrate-binding protein